MESSHRSEQLLQLLSEDQPVPAKVWLLYQLAQKLTGGTSTLLEWDANIPSFPELVEELNKAKQVLAGHIPEQDMIINTGALSTPIVNERLDATHHILSSEQS